MRYFLITLLTICCLSQNTRAEGNVYTILLNKSTVIKGLHIKLLNRTKYEPMTGTSAVFEVMYKGRKDFIIMGAGGCEPDPEFINNWQGHTFRLKDFKGNQTSSVKLELIREKITGVNAILSQDSLQVVYQKIKELMNVKEGQPGNAEMSICRTEGRLISVNYLQGWRYPHNKWEKHITEQLQIQGNEKNLGYRFVLMKDGEGNIIIKSNPTERNEEGIEHCLKWVLSQ